MSRNRVRKGFTLQNFDQTVINGKIKESCPGAGYPLLPTPLTAIEKGSELLRHLCAAGGAVRAVALGCGPAIAMVVLLLALRRLEINTFECPSFPQHLPYSCWSLCSKPFPGECKFPQGEESILETVF